MDQNHRVCWIAALLFMYGSLTAQGADKSDKPPTKKQIATWIQQLDDDSFSVRESATRNLLNAGKATIRAVW